MPKSMPQPNRRCAGLTFSVATLAGLIVTAIIMSIAWEHNPQGEFHDETGIHWGYFILLGAFWFFTVTGIPYFATLVLLVSELRTRKRQLDGTRTI
jgi:hypothetical protein